MKSSKRKVVSLTRVRTLSALLIVYSHWLETLQIPDVHSSLTLIVTASGWEQWITSLVRELLWPYPFLLAAATVLKGLESHANLYLTRGSSERRTCSIHDTCTQVCISEHVPSDYRMCLNETKTVLTNDPFGLFFLKFVGTVHI